MQSLQMQLLHLLQEDCRLPLEKLAVMTGSTVETVATVIDDMERSGIILRYAPVINWDKTDRERVGLCRHRRAHLPLRRGQIGLSHERGL